MKLFRRGFIAFLMASSFLSAVLYAQSVLTPRQLFLGPLPEFSSHPIVKKLIKAKTPVMREKIKIEYLASRIRDSKHTFVRRGEEHNGDHAAEFLLWKCKRRPAEAKTALDFIQNLASKSKSTGTLYKVKISKKNVYPLGDVLSNELHELLRYLSVAESMLQTAKS